MGQFNAIQQDLNSQPASQPLDASFDMESPYQGLDEGVWGQLYPHIPNAGFESGQLLSWGRPIIVTMSSGRVTWVHTGG